MRIVRQFGQGKITREIAYTMLRGGLGMTDDEIMQMLGEQEEFGAQISLDETIAIFAEYGEPRDNFDVIKSSPLKFAEVEDETDKRILDILNRQPLTPVADIAKALRKDEQEIQERINSLVAIKVLEVNDKGEIKPTRPLSKIVDEPTKTVFEIRYSYEWRSIVPSGQRKESTSREFCQKIMDLDRFWTRKEIEQLTVRLGYDVFSRAGGWWTSPINPNPVQCRHEWRSNILIKKKK
jgi:DNA-binding Lrp family transcriptional regulator